MGWLLAIGAFVVMNLLMLFGDWLRNAIFRTLFDVEWCSKRETMSFIVAFNVVALLGALLLVVYLNIR